MTMTVCFRLPDGLFSELARLAASTDRSRSYIMKKALEQYLEEYADYRIALNRFKDEEDGIISSEEMRKLLDNENPV